MRFNNKNIVLPEKIITYYLYDYIHMDATDYAQSKKSYIDLDYVPTLTTNVEITFKLSGDYVYGDSYFFGMNGNQALYYPTGGYGNRIRSIVESSVNKYYFEPTYGNYFKDKATPLSIDQDYTVRFDQTTTPNHFALYKDGVEVTSINWSLASSLQNLSLFLFATNNPSGTYNYAYPNEWVKEIKIYEGTTLVRDYKPALHIQSNEPCLVDVLHNTHFYFATGTGKMALEGLQVLLLNSIYRDENHLGHIMFPYRTDAFESIEMTFKITSNTGYIFRDNGSSKHPNVSWKFYADGNNNNIKYTVPTEGNETHTMSSLLLGPFSDYYNIKRHIRFDGAPMRVYDCDTSTYLGETCCDDRIGEKVFTWGYDASAAPGQYYADTVSNYLYEVTLYSDNDGTTPLAHYIPAKLGNSIGLYDTISDTFISGQGTLGYEYNS